MAGFLLFYVGSFATYYLGLNAEIDLANERQLSERLVTLRRALARVPPSQREEAAQSLAGPGIDIHWSTLAPSIDPSVMSEQARRLATHIQNIAREIQQSDLRVGPHSSTLDDNRTGAHVLAALRLPDDTWLNFNIYHTRTRPFTFAGLLSSLGLVALAVGGLSIGILGSVTRSLQRFAPTAKQLYVSAEPAPVQVSGPSEVRELAAAFNGLQSRVKRLVDDRTLTLAAISHDLKSPLARAQLRIEEIDEPELKGHLQADFREMLAMIDGTLAFLKGDQTDEALRDVDLSALLESICDDMSDLGSPISFARRDTIVVRGRLLALKRALTNLIGNAAKFARRVEVVAIRRAGLIGIAIDDDGPGIPRAERQAVFEPFYRLDGSRSSAAAGTGLGLTVARTIIEGHGGDITLCDSLLGGLKVVVRLPDGRGPSGNNL